MSFKWQSAHFCPTHDGIVLIFSTPDITGFGYHGFPYLAHWASRPSDAQHYPQRVMGFAIEGMLTG